MTCAMPFTSIMLFPLEWNLVGYMTSVVSTGARSAPVETTEIDRGYPSVDDPVFVRLLDRLVVVGLIRLRLVQVVALLVHLDDRPTFVPFHHGPAERVAAGQAAIEGIAAVQRGHFAGVRLVALQDEHRPRAEGLHQERCLPIRPPCLRWLARA